jgi:hypothetical protein
VNNKSYQLHTISDIIKKYIRGFICTLSSNMFWVDMLLRVLNETHVSMAICVLVERVLLAGYVLTNMEKTCASLAICIAKGACVPSKICSSSIVKGTCVLLGVVDVDKTYVSCILIHVKMTCIFWFKFFFVLFY